MMHQADGLTEIEPSSLRFWTMRSDPKAPVDWLNMACINTCRTDTSWSGTTKHDDSHSVL
jgi:hypothetical protein